MVLMLNGDRYDIYSIGRWGRVKREDLFFIFQPQLINLISMIDFGL